MKYLRLVVRYASKYQRPMHRFMTENDAIEREWLVTWGIDTEKGIIYGLFYIVGERKPYEKALSAIDSCEDYDLTPDRDGAFYAFVRGRETDQSRKFYALFEQPSLIVVPPIAYRPHGIMAFDVVGEHAALERVLNELPEGITAEVRKVGEYDARPGTFAIDLTARQREALAAARQVGYYEVPRTGSVADVASELNCAPSTASNHLRKAEARLVERAFE